jgi:type I restriction-modification system DNA methylase subunit
MASELKTPELSRIAAAAFADKWKSYTDEKQHARGFWSDFFRALCGVDDEEIAGIEYEKRVKSTISGNQEYIDVYWKNVALIEHKSAGENLDKAELQARGYWLSLPPGYRPKTIIISDFLNFRLIDVALNRTHDFPLSKLPENVHRFEAIISGNRTRISEEEITVDQVAAKLMANLYLELEDHGYEGHETSIFLIRILFLLFGDDTGMWAKNSFLKLVMRTKEDGSDVGSKLDTLFEILNTPEEKRPKALGEEFKPFPYVNGGIFAEKISVIDFNKKMRVAFVEVANYDWTTINPTIFGSLFQLIKNKEARRELGEHYTSEENINKIVYPLFLDELQERLAVAWDNKKELKKLRQDLAKVKVFDPACGCGNFLVVSYRHLRQLELELIVRLNNLEGVHDSMQLDGSMGLSISLNQFYGIEIEEWPAQVARMALFLTDHQENLRLERITGATPNRFPLKDFANIVNMNALQTDWSSVLQADEYTYILGNPPFLGHKERNKLQANDHTAIWKDINASGTLDYVTCWFLLAAKLMKKSKSRAAFVSTNSISQGRQPDVLWQGLNQYDVKIDFAVQSFSWSNESAGEAAVTCVIIGFSSKDLQTKRKLWVRGEQEAILVEQINPYLVDGPQVTTPSRKTPISTSITSANYGSMAIDDGHLIFDAEEAEAAQLKDKSVGSFLSRIIGGREMLYNEMRYCLWLVDATPRDIANSVVIQERLKRVTEFRKSSSRAATQKLASFPTLFGENRQPISSYVALAKVSSEKRAYLPAEVFEPDVIASGSVLTICSESPAFDFAVVCSRPMSVWNASVSGRMEMRFQISVEITYNNFPLPTVTPQQKMEIAKLAEDVLQVRRTFGDSTIAELYGEVSMPSKLLKVHQELDSYMLSLYGLKLSSTDSQILKALFEAYANLTDDKLI